MQIPVGPIIPNHGSRIRLLLLPIRPNIPIHVMMTTPMLRMLMVTMLLILGIVVVVEVIEGRRRRRIFREARLLLLLVGVVISSGKVLLGRDWRELGGVVVGGC